jgi:hypothetical protein
MAVAMNASAPEDALQALAKDDEWAVRKVASSNPKAPSAGKKEGCFVATAATGSYDHGITRTLRKFRDFHLDSRPAGRGFIRWYYQVSPPLASWIEKRPWFGGMVKWGVLYPIARLLELTMPS